MSNANHITQGHLDRLTDQLFRDQMFQGEQVKDACATFQFDTADEAAQVIRERDATIIRLHEALWQANESFAVANEVIVGALSVDGANLRPKPANR